jgi:hypothetical protein
MTTVISGSSPSITFSDATTQTTAFTSTPSVTSITTSADATINGVTVGRGTNSLSTNTAMGTSALLASNSGTGHNVANGYQALTANLTGLDNVGVGYQALLTTQNDYQNTAVGSGALKTLNGTSNNTAVGYQAGYSGTTSGGGGNVAIGSQAFYTATSSQNSVAIGYQAGYLATGQNNTFVGQAAGYPCTGSYNNFFGGGNGRAAGSSMTTGSNNTILGGFNGNQSGLDIRTSSGNLVCSGGDGVPLVWFANSGVYSATNSSSWNTVSDERIKENFVLITNGLEVINALEPFEFDFKLTGKHEVGFKAQQYGTVLPDQITENDCVTEELKELTNGEPVKGIQRNLDPYFVSAIKTLITQVTELNAKVTALENK